MSAKPDQIKLSAEKVQELQNKIKNTNLTSEDQRILTGLVSSCLWLQDKLIKSKLTISKLKDIFGITTEKKTLQ